MKSFLTNIGLRHFFKRWWLSLLLIPFMVYHLHQAYWVLRYNIFFSISYSFPFPVSIENTVHTTFLLIVHEAGHTFFGLFGHRTLTILGGSLNELLLVGLILGYFLYNKVLYGVQYACYLLGLAWIGTGFYASDATARQLPLIGNLGSDAHDWYNLLSRWDLLGADHLIGTLFVLTGALCFTAALTAPFWVKRYQYIHPEINV